MVPQNGQPVPPGAVRHNSRGLCSGCRSHVDRYGDLADYQRTTRSLDDTVTDYQILRDRGLDHDQVAHQLGVKPASLQRQLERARARDHHTTRSSSTCEEYAL
jgi:predicted Abi (CAAX) family protease